MKQNKWVRYRHKKNPQIEYDVRHVNTLSDEPNPMLREYEGPTVTDSGEKCYLVRTVRNLLYKEEVHQSAYTYMPTKNFLETYKRV